MGVALIWTDRAFNNFGCLQYLSRFDVEGGYYDYYRATVSVVRDKWDPGHSLEAESDLNIIDPYSYR